MPAFLNGNTGEHPIHVPNHESTNMEPMAIIGMAIRATDEATDVEAFWHFLLRARQGSRPIPEDRLSSKAFYHPDPNHGGTFSIKGASFLGENPNGFDAAFFKMSKTEVQSLDPQQRILMENVYHAIENAGLPMEDVISSNTSVFLSGFNHHHADRLSGDHEISFKHKPTGLESSMISGRVSWFYDFKGASLTVDTACSSSLVAVHLARQNLAAKESEMSIVSGVNVIGYLPYLMSMSHSSLLGPEGKSMAFDEQADGYGLGEGVGTIVLKPLSAAVCDGDTIRGIIRGTGVNHDGRTPGLTYPSVTAQESLIRKTYIASGLSPKDTIYVESHGTGTQAGDLVECTAISGAFETQQREGPFYVGAVKPNVGHLEGGAGVTGIIKSVLALEAGVIPPNATLNKVNRKIPGDWNLCFPTTCIPWPTPGIRRSSISSFGMSGTNAHCILDDAYHYLNQRGISACHKTSENVPSEKDMETLLARLSTIYQIEAKGVDFEAPVSNGHDTVSRTDELNGTNGAHATNGINGTKDIHLNLNKTALPSSKPPTILIFSAFDEKSLEKVVAQTKKHASFGLLGSGVSGSQALVDLAFSLSEKKARLPWKTFALCKSVEEIQAKLNMLPSNAIKSRSPLRIGFVFTGQGAQYAQMGQQLFVYPVFKESLKAADLYFRSLGNDWSLLEELSRSSVDSNISRSAFAHPISCAVQIALLDLLLSWNVIPHRVTGHSSGEIAAAYCAGKISREAAWRVAYFRGHVLRLAKAPCAGGMIAVGLDEGPLLHLIKKVHSRFPGHVLSIACYNSPRNHTVSGDEAMVDALKEILDEQGVFVRKLKVEHAAHSAHMEYFSADYDQLLGTLPQKRHLRFGHTVDMFSTLTGLLMDDSCAAGKASHWSHSMVCPVRFTKALSSMCFDPTTTDSPLTHDKWVDVILEVGPHPAMQSASKEIIGSRAEIPYMATLNRKDNGLTTLLETIGSLATRGASVDLDRVNRATYPSVLPKMLVDLPPYPFNHEEKGLYESRLIKNTRLRQFPRHDLFGAPVPDWNPNSPRWRHFLRVSENPWLKEHVIGDDYVFPGAGYIAMAVEAIKQITESTEMIGINLRDILFKSMLVVPDDMQGVEVCLSFYPVPDSKTSISTVWRRFEVASYNAETEEWIEHCTGEISPDLKSLVNSIDGSRQEQNKKADWSAFVQAREKSCQFPIDFDSVYKHLRDIGVNHGLSFRNLLNVTIGDRKEGLMAGDIVVPNVTQLMPKQYVHEHLIHPTTLDNAFHAAFAAIYDLNGKQMMRRGCVPSSVRKIWLSTKWLSSKPGTTLRCTSHSSRGPHDSFENSVYAWDPSDSSVNLLSLAGAKLTPFKPEGGDARTIDTPSCYTIDWHPDLDFITHNDLQKLFSWPESPSESYAAQLERYSKLQLVSTLLATDGLVATREVKKYSLEDQQRNYLEILQSIASSITIDDIPYVSLETWLKYSRNPALKKELFRQVEDRDPTGALLIKMGSRISPILRNEFKAEDILYGPDDLFWVWDESNLYQGSILPTLEKFLTLLCGSHYSLRILDVRPNTGSLAEKILKIIYNDKSAHAIEYVIGAPADSFGTSKKRLAEWENVIKYRELDLGVDPFQQGFEPQSFDIIIANNYLHGGLYMEEILSRLNSLTRPGGRLLVLDHARPESLHTNVLFGALSTSLKDTGVLGKFKTLAVDSEWDISLQKTGYSGIDFEASSSTYAEFADLTLMASTSLNKTQNPTLPSSKVLVILQSHSDISRLLTARLVDAGVNHSICLLNELCSKSLRGRICVSLLEAEDPILNTMDSSVFQKIQELVTSSDSLLWVTGDPLVQPEFQMATGLLRTIRWELDRNNLNLVTLSLNEDATTTASENIDAVLRVFQHQFLDQGPNPKSANAEYRFRNQMIETNRIVKNMATTSTIETKLSGPKAILSQWNEVERPVRLTSLHPGIDRLTWATDDDHSEKPLNVNEVEIEVHAVGLNFKDILVAMGEISQPGFGHEAAGTIVAVGSSVKDLKPGDRVMCLGDPSPGRMGTLRTRSRVHSNLAIKIPNALSFEVAAGLPIIYGTVIYSLGYIARLHSGEKVLIHAAAGGIGQAAIQYAQFKGAEIFVTLSSIEKKQFIMDTFGIPEDHIFSSRDLTFSSGIRRISPAGVDVVLNSLSGEALRQSWACVAPFGRFVEIGKLDFQAGSKLDMTPFQDNVTFSGVDLNALAEARPVVCQGLLQEIMHLWSNQKIHEARPTKVLEYGQLKEGMRLLQTGKSIGKITLIPGSHPISVLPAPLPSLQLDSQASFILAGGLGGIGRSISLKLASIGARNLIFLSRSATVHEAGQKTIADLKSLGCRSYVFQCDISDETRLREVFEQIRKTLPPVKGCIQCCFVLKDGAFDSMSHRDWQTVLAPKVSGSWNLHRLLPEVDFFLMLSSITGIVGNRSQANYNAGNNFQDALARHRVSQGMRGASVNLGAVVGIGFIAENAEYAGKHTFKIANPQTEEEVLATIEYLIDHRHQSTTILDNAQLVCGLRTPTSYSLHNEEQPTHLGYPMFSKLPSPPSGSSNILDAGGGKSATHIRDHLQAATNQNDAAQLIHKAIRCKMADLLNVCEDSFDDSLDVRANGVDSLIEMEFRTWFAKELGVTVPLKYLAKDLNQLSVGIVSLSGLTKFC